MNNTNFSAIILAAGFSSRMQKFKPLIRIGGKSFEEHAISITVEDPFIRLDADTPQDLLSLKKMMHGGAISN